MDEHDNGTRLSSRVITVVSKCSKVKSSQVILEPGGIITKVKQNKETSKQTRRERERRKEGKERKEKTKPTSSDDDAPSIPP